MKEKRYIQGHWIERCDECAAWLDCEGVNLFNACNKLPSLYCDKHYDSVVMAGNCCSGNEADYR